MNKDQILLLKEYLSPDLLQSLLIEESLQKTLVDKPLETDVFDLNPHIHVSAICDTIVKQVTDQGIECKKEDVMLYWLTKTLYK